MRCYKIIYQDGTVKFIPAYYAERRGERVICLMEHNTVIECDNVQGLTEVCADD